MMEMECNHPSCLGNRVNLGLSTPPVVKFFKSRTSDYGDTGHPFYFARCEEHGGPNEVAYEFIYVISVEEYVVAGVMCE